MTKAEFLKLPMGQRGKILEEQAESVADIYNTPPGLCPDPIPDHIQELTTLRARVRELEEKNAHSLEGMHKLGDLVNEGVARIRELEEALIKSSKTFPNPELKEQADRIKELEEAMPKPEALRRMANDFDDGYFTFAAPFRRMADRIEKVMTKQPSEK